MAIKKKPPKKIVSFTLPPDIIDYLDEQADEEWLSRSAYLTRLVGRMLDHEMKQKMEKETDE